MTRVSDRAAFAREVAAAGGLPFLALALMRGPQVRALLEETAAALGERPWGVGLLGFAPPELRAEQLRVVRDIRPPCALIAGGRPAQSAPLEADGIDTFLHAPSPGLLQRFLGEGARRFVFEGRECGGHVGPRTSFALWEAQISVLEEFGAGLGARGADFFDQLHLLFAGGVHDERSAAMVSAAAASLAARGAKVGVLMGTAYLFTPEAVDSGAIVAGFQEAALGCERTVLLETSPGHATRCVDSPFVRTFQETRAELAARGQSSRQVWEELERLNLGRLRIASKGLRRVGDELVRVDEAGQADEGMVMIGQVGALRHSRLSIAELHRQVTEGAAAVLTRRAAELGHAARTDPQAQVAAPDPQGETADREALAARSVAAVRASARPLDVAIVGMAAVFPGAPDVEAYWANVVGGVDAVTEVSPQRWDPAVYADPGAATPGAGERTPSRWGGFLAPLPFDAFAYGIPPTSLRSIGPDQLLALEVAARALRDAGYDRRSFDRARTSVVFGAEAGADLAAAYGLRSLLPAYFDEVPPELDEHLPRLDEDSFPGILSNVIAGRIANRLNLGGVNFTIDAACASSLAALDAACKELVGGTSDMVLCGGVDTHNSVHDFLMFSSVHALSPTGRSRSFDMSADGISLGEGVAVVVLKRLADAERDGDRIHAVIKAVAGSSDGRAQGMTAPNVTGQTLALDRAYAHAGISPSEIGLVEAHATGTVVGDRTELAGLTKVFTQHGAEPGACAIGSVKSQIGHTKCAAGLAGLIKAAKAVSAGVRPPTLHLTRPNTVWDRGDSPFSFDTVAAPWTAPPEHRHAGVSAFGFGGTNFHAVLSAYTGGPEPAHGLDAWPAELFVIHGADRAAAVHGLDRLAALARGNDEAGRPLRLRDLARTACAQGSGRVQVAFVAAHLDDVAGLIAAARALRTDRGAGVFAADDEDAGQVAFLFPGQGSQRPRMLADLFVAFPRLRSVLDLGPHWADLLFPSAAFGGDEAAAQTAAITDTRAAQPTLGIAGLAMADILAGLAVRADHLAGHSYGELVALCVSGALRRRDLIPLSEARARAVLDAAADYAARPGGPGRVDPGAVDAGDVDAGIMAAVSASPEQVRRVLGAGPDGAGPDGVVVANHNAPKQTVISGPTAAVEAAIIRLSGAGAAARRIATACAFHSPVVAAASGQLARRLEDLTVRAPSTPVWSNTTAARYPDSVDGVRATLAGQVAEPVRFVEQIEAMYAAGARTFVEVGPGRVLTGLTGKILAGRPHRAVATDVAGEHGLRRLLLALAELAAAGVAMDVMPLFVGRDTRTASVDTLARRPGWLVDGAYVRTGDGEFLTGGLRPAHDLAPISLSAPPNPEAVTQMSGDDGMDRAVIEFLRASRELAVAQRDVVLGYFGAAERPGSTVPGVVLPPARTTGWSVDLDGPSDIARTTVPVPSGGSARPPSESVPSADRIPPAELLRRGRPDGAAAAAVDGPPGSVAGAGLDRESVSGVVVEVIGAQTGYPAEMLEPDLDLEADLSIDSIKRTEVLGALAGRLGLGDLAGGD
ncbi:type I polyketide synthase, partial [Frankia gtarii]